MKNNQTKKHSDNKSIFTYGYLIKDKETDKILIKKELFTSREDALLQARMDINLHNLKQTYIETFKLTDT